jgi:hypothetical protein
MLANLEKDRRLMNSGEPLSNSLILASSRHPFLTFTASFTTLKGIAFYRPLANILSYEGWLVRREF